MTRSEHREKGDWAVVHGHDDTRQGSGEEHFECMTARIVAFNCCWIPK